MKGLPEDQSNWEKQIKNLLKLDWLGTVFPRMSPAHPVDVCEETLHCHAT